MILLQCNVFNNSFSNSLKKSSQNFLQIRRKHDIKKVVITGLGIVSSIGVGVDAVLKSLREGKSGIKKSQDFVDRQMRSQVAGLVDIDLKEFIDRRALRFMGEAAAYSYIAMKEAIAMAGLTEEDISNERTGLFTGSGGGDTKAIVDAADILREKGVKRLALMQFLRQ